MANSACHGDARPASTNLSVSEAQERLNEASKAIDALLQLLSGYSGTVGLRADSLYYLLQPIGGDIDAALDELTVAKSCHR